MPRNQQRPKTGAVAAWGGRRMGEGIVPKQAKITKVRCKIPPIAMWLQCWRHDRLSFPQKTSRKITGKMTSVANEGDMSAMAAFLRSKFIWERTHESWIYWFG